MKPKEKDFINEQRAMSIDPTKRTNHLENSMEQAQI